MIQFTDKASLAEVKMAIAKNQEEGVHDDYKEFLETLGNIILNELKG